MSENMRGKHEGCDNNKPHRLLVDCWTQYELDPPVEDIIEENSDVCKSTNSDRLDIGSL